MIIDLHFHTEKYSLCSRIPLETGIERAAAMGLDGICITEHDVFHKECPTAELERRYGIKIFHGVEINTVEGDILCFGLYKIPPLPISAFDLVSLVNRAGGATIAAHPFRDNNRGIKDLAASLSGLTAIEGWNGNTLHDDNIRALDAAKKAVLPVTGASDSHRMDRIGCFATEFLECIFSEKELIKALKEADFYPVKFNDDTGYFCKI